MDQTIGLRSTTTRWPVLAKKQWPQVRFKEKRTITFKGHQAIIANELNLERRAFYEFCWYLAALGPTLGASPPRTSIGKAGS
ncbi:MAG: hypothetical protein ABSH34_34930 [Verrucomicrobiota bacterium]|jgi:hypothetical protein